MITSLLARGRTIDAKAPRKQPATQPTEAWIGTALATLRAELEGRIADALERADNAEQALDAAQEDTRAARAVADSAIERLAAVSETAARTLEGLQLVQKRLSGIEEQMAAECARRDRMHENLTKIVTSIKIPAPIKQAAPKPVDIELPEYEMTVVERNINDRASRIVLRPIKKAGG